MRIIERKWETTHPNSAPDPTSSPTLGITLLKGQLENNPVSPGRHTTSARRGQYISVYARKLKRSSSRARKPKGCPWPAALTTSSAKNCARFAMSKARVTPGVERYFASMRDVRVSIAASIAGSKPPCSRPEYFHIR